MKGKFTDFFNLKTSRKKEDNCKFVISSETMLSFEDKFIIKLIFELGAFFFLFFNDSEHYFLFNYTFTSVFWIRVHNPAKEKLFPIFFGQN